MDKIKAFLRSLNIYFNGYETEDGYIIDLKSDNEWGRVYSLLEQSDDINQETNTNQLSEDGSYMTFINDDFEIILEANFIDDIYKLTIIPLNDIKLDLDNKEK